MKFVYRDDYISKDTNPDILQYTHRQFMLHHLTHTVSLVCHDLELNPKIVNYIRHTSNWDLCVHGWDYINYAKASKERIAGDLDKCILKIEELFGFVPEKWYLPEFRFDDEMVARVADIATYHGIDVDTDYERIGIFIDRLESGKNPITETVCFHSWNIDDLKMLPNLLYLTRKYCEGRVLPLDNLARSVII